MTGDGTFDTRKHVLRAGVCCCLCLFFVPSPTPWPLVLGSFSARAGMGPSQPAPLSRGPPLPFLSPHPQVAGRGIVDDVTRMPVGRRAVRSRAERQPAGLTGGATLAALPAGDEPVRDGLLISRGPRAARHSSAAAGLASRFQVGVHASERIVVDVGH